MRTTLLAFLALLTACSTTRVQGTWAADERPASLQRTLVVGLSEEVTWARSFESEVVRRLKAAGVDAVPLSQLEHNGLRQKTADESRAELRAIVEAHGFDTVLVGHLSGLEAEVEAVEVRPMAFDPWWGWAWGGWWYGPGYGYPYFGYAAPAYSVRRNWRVETRLFEGQGERQLIWSMVVTTEQEPLKAIDDVADTTVEQLAQEELLPGR